MAKRLGPYESDREKLGALLREARGRAGISQSVLADKLARPQSFVSGVEKGERPIEAVELVSLCLALGIKAGDVLNRLDQLD